MHLKILHISSIDKFYSEKLRFQISLIDRLNFFEGKLLTVFYASLGTLAIRNGSVLAKIFGAVLMLVHSLTYVYTLLISKDYEYESKNLDQGTNYSKDYIKYASTFLFCVLNSAVPQTEVWVRQAVNFAFFGVEILILVD